MNYTKFRLLEAVRGKSVVILINNNIVKLTFISYSLEVVLKSTSYKSINYSKD